MAGNLTTRGLGLPGGLLVALGLGAAEVAPTEPGTFTTLGGTAVAGGGRGVLTGTCLWRPDDGRIGGTGGTTARPHGSTSRPTGATQRPVTGTTARPLSQTARPTAGTSARPTGTTARPSTGSIMRPDGVTTRPLVGTTARPY